MSDESTPKMSLDQAKALILDMAATHIMFDGISDEALTAAVKDAGVDPAQARAIFPRGPLDMGIALHLRGDEALKARIAAEDMSGLRYSEKVARAIMLRLEIGGSDKEAVRRATSFFALPQNAIEGAKCIWNTADTIWTALGDTSDDLNWYSKRTILSGVYSASVIFWLGDESPDHEKTAAFVDRRIANVMQFEKTKAQVKGSRAYAAFRKGPGRILDAIKAPGVSGMNDLPGQWRK